MVQDPYKVLGVSRDATDEQIKKAYRELSKKYHPDLNPGDESAAKRMSEINAAYDQIQKKGTGAAYGGSDASYGSSGAYGSSSGTGGYYSSYGFGGFDDFFRNFNGYGGQRQQQERGEYQAARNYIRNGMYREAINALSGVDIPERDGRWYYLYAMANYRSGNRSAAYDAASKACNIEPDNEEYRQLFEAIKSGSTAYDEYSTRYSNFSPVRGGGNLCYYGLAAMCLSSFCGRGAFPFWCLCL